jgi:peptidyl-tRNA hydrolase, PTH1 family
MKLIVGLGNPGDRYARNRHNIGFMAVERIGDRHRFQPWRKRFQGMTSEGEIAGERAILLKPETFMNESGRSAGEAMRFLKIPLDDLIVFHDELDLSPGRLKVKTGGSDAGHNGLRSLTAHLGPAYGRVRLGIGHPGHKDAVAGYVLHDFARADSLWLEPLLDAIGAAVPQLTAGKPDRFQSEIARLTVEGGGPGPSGDAPQAPVQKPAPARHPAGERQSKQKTALADNLKKWLAGRKGD